MTLAARGVVSFCLHRNAPLTMPDPALFNRRNEKSMPFIYW
jgi:hypothetical protein